MMDVDGNHLSCSLNEKKNQAICLDVDEPHLRSLSDASKLLKLIR